MSANRTLWMLGGLAAAAGLYVYTRTKKGELQLATFLDDVVPQLQDIVVSSVELPQSVKDAFSSIGQAVSSVGGWLSKVPERFKSAFSIARAKYSLPANLLERVAYQESRFRDDIISGKTISSAGAVGIMQIVPKWHPGVNALDPEASIEYAAKYLRQLFNQFGSWKMALAAYNWGPGNLSKDLQDKIIGNSWPEETRRYVAEISADVGLA